MRLGQVGQVRLDWIRSDQVTVRLDWIGLGLTQTDRYPGLDVDTGEKLVYMSLGELRIPQSWTTFLPDQATN